MDRGDIKTSTLAHLIHWNLLVAHLIMFRGVHGVSCFPWFTLGETASVWMYPTPWNSLLKTVDTGTSRVRIDFWFWDLLTWTKFPLFCFRLVILSVCCVESPLCIGGKPCFLFIKSAKMFVGSKYQYVNHKTKSGCGVCQIIYLIRFLSLENSLC